MAIQFKLDKLPYNYDALEPAISEETLKVHHDKHHQTYCDKFNAALKEYNVKTENFKEILSVVSDKLAIRNHGGGFYNHNFYWESMTENFLNIKNYNEINQKIIDSFGSFENFKKEFSTQAAAVFGSGWTWLGLNEQDNLIIYNTPNQDNYMMDICPNNEKPILVIDVWEHAYYIDSQNKRPEYIENFFKVISWKKVNQRLKKIIDK
jgi:Fe-Mn family superoxide dismutase